MHCRRSLYVRLLGRSGGRRVPPSNSLSLSSPKHRSHLWAGLSLGPHPAAAAAGSRRPGDQRPWRRLRALRLPRLCRGHELHGLPRVLNPPDPIQEKSKNPGLYPKDLALCLKCPSNGPDFPLPNPHLSGTHSIKSWNALLTL